MTPRSISQAFPGLLARRPPGSPASWLTIMFTLLAFLQPALGQQNNATIFLPGIVSTDSIDFNACFSKDGNSFYFSRTIGKKSQILVTHQRNGEWSTPARLPFCKTEFAYADPAFSPEGELYFISNKPTSSADNTSDYNIWKTSFASGQWKDPVNVSALNSPQDEYYISFTAKGDAYFSSSRPGGYGEEDIYMSKLINGSYDKPVNLGADVNTIHSEYDPFINKNGNILIFTSSGRKDSFGKADLYWIEKQKEWGPTNHFGSQINTPSRDYCPYVADDGTFYFSSEGEVKASQASLRRSRSNR